MIYRYKNQAVDLCKVVSMSIRADEPMFIDFYLDSGGALSFASIVTNDDLFRNNHDNKALVDLYRKESETIFNDIFEKWQMSKIYPIKIEGNV